MPTDAMETLLALASASSIASQALEALGLSFSELRLLLAIRAASVLAGMAEDKPVARAHVTVGPDGQSLYRRLILDDGRARSTGTQLEDEIEAAIQEAWRRLLHHVGPPDLDGRPILDGEPAS